MAETAINGVSKGATSLWNMASGYASQMFTEEDLEATPVLVGTSHEPIILDRLQAQLHAATANAEMLGRGGSKWCGTAIKERMVLEYDLWMVMQSPQTT